MNSLERRRRTAAQQGRISEAAVSLDLLKRGYNVLKLEGDGHEFDLAMEDSNIFQKLQVKTGQYYSDTSFFARVTPSGNNKYNLHDFDWVAIYYPATDECYYVPHTEELTSVTLHFKPAGKYANYTHRMAKHFQSLELPPHPDWGTLKYFRENPGSPEAREALGQLEGDSVGEVNAPPEVPCELVKCWELWKPISL